MKKILLLLLSVFSFAAFFVSAETTVLWEGLFNEFETDNLLCGLEDPFSGYVIDKMTANCAPSTGDEPFGDEFAIVEDAETGNKLLKVCRKSIGEDSKGCRGVRTKLTWGETEYDASKGFLKIEGRVKAAAFTELRIANVNGACMARFGLNGGPDINNKAYLAHYGYNLNEVVSDAVNKGDERFFVSSDDLGWNLAKFSGIPADGNWYNFELCLDLSVCDLAYFTVWSDDQSYFDIYTGRCNALTYQGYRPTYICFTSWAKNNEAREASYFSNLKVSYVLDEEEENWETFFEDDFSAYQPGQSLFNVNPEFIQTGDNAPNLEATIIDHYEGVSFESNAVYFAVNNATEATPKAGIALSVPRDMFDYPNAKLRISLKAYYKDGGTGYGELRLATAADKPMMRFCFRSSDYQTYCYTDNRREGVNNGAANYGDARWPSASADKIKYNPDDSVLWNTWCDFALVVDCHTGTLLNYNITDNAGFEFTGDKVCQLYEFGTERPAYVEFTAVGNGYNTTRNGYFLDDLTVTYVKENTPWVTVFEDDFQSYTLGESLTAQNAEYQRIGNDAAYSDLIEEDLENYPAYGQYAKVWLNTPSGYPRDGVKVMLPDSCVPVEGGKLRLTTRFYCPDNGCWNIFFKEDSPVASYGFHSANRWFATWGSNDTTPRYDGMENGPYNDWINFMVTVAYDGEGGAYLESAVLNNAKDATKRQGLRWCGYFDTTMPGAPDSAGVQVQGWANFAGRYALINYIKVEYAAPEPAFLGLLALAGLAILRKRS